MIFGCLITILALIFTLFILILVGISITFGLLIKIILPFALIALGINIINRRRRY